MVSSQWLTNRCRFWHAYWINAEELVRDGWRVLYYRQPVDMASACCLVLDGSATFVRGWRAFRQRRRISMNISLALLRRRVNLCRAHAGLSGKEARADWTGVKASSRQWVGIGLFHETWRVAFNCAWELLKGCQNLWKWRHSLFMVGFEGNNLLCPWVHHYIMRYNQFSAENIIA